MDDLHKASLDAINSAIGSNTSSRPILSDGVESSWHRVPYQVSLGASFETVTDDLAFRSQKIIDVDSDGKPKKSLTVSSEDLQKFFGLDVEDPTVQTLLAKAYHQDTRVGANDAINCLWQFNRDDDILHPACIIDKSMGIGLSRVYTNTTQTNQQICYFTFGIPYYSSLFAFHKHAFDKSLAELNTKGYTSDEGSETLGELMGEAVAMVVSIPIIPLKMIYETFQHSSFNYHINRFYELRARMNLYYRYVDAMLAHWLVAAGLYGNIIEIEGMANTALAKPEALPEALRLTGCSIWDIVTRRARNAGVYRPNYKDHKSIVNRSLVGESAKPIRYHDSDLERAVARKSGEVTVQSATAGVQSQFPIDNSWANKNYDEFFTTDKSYDEFFTADMLTKKKNYNVATGNDQDIQAYDDDHGDWATIFCKSALGATQFIGFRVDKSTDASESFSNSTSPSAYAEEFNSKVRELAAKAIDSGIKGSESGDTWFESLVTDTKSVIAGVLNFMKKVDFIGISDLADAAVSGMFLDVPEQYSGSDFNKSHSLSFQLRSPYGDKVSIYQSIIVPLACILAGALPRAGGANSYVQPFLCRIYCKGMFAVPMGIIDSVSIKRGDSEFGWTYDSLPTCIDVNISIKDMSPIMYMIMYDKPFTSLIGLDNAFNEYMLTLAGVGLFERISQVRKIVRGMGYAAHMLRNRYFNPLYWSHSISQFTVVQFVASFVPKVNVGTT